MNRTRMRKVATAIMTIVFAIMSIAQSEPASARTYTQALPGFEFSFPKDHCSHEDYRTEWWYFTGHLVTEQKRQFGYELTFFRTGLDESEGAKPPWNLNNLYLAHFALTDEQGQKFHFQERMNRAGVKVADALADRPFVYNENWSMEMLGDQIALRADTTDYSIHLLLNTHKAPAIHGKDGVSQKADCKGCASHYYSMTHLDTSGYVTLDKQSYKVSGTSWMDHEFGSNQLTANQVGWDWYSVQLENNTEIMLYVMRNADGSIDPNSSGTVILPDGSTKRISNKDFTVKTTGTWSSPSSKGKYPMGWSASIPAMHAQLEIKPSMKDQELVTAGSTDVTYWEGSGSVSGTYQDKKVSGKSYVEMTGYAGRFNKRI